MDLNENDIIQIFSIKIPVILTSHFYGQKCPFRINFNFENLKFNKETFITPSFNKKILT